MARIRLDRVTIVRSALVVLERQPFDQLTLAAVADQLGVGSPALYNHLESLDELRYAVAVHSAEALVAALRDAAIGRSGPVALEAMARAYRDFAVDHPAQFASTLRSPRVDDDLLAEALGSVIDLFERVIASGFGLRAEKATHAARATVSALHGFVGLEVIERVFERGPDADASFEHVVAGLLASMGSE